MVLLCLCFQIEKSVYRTYPKVILREGLLHNHVVRFGVPPVIIFSEWVRWNNDPFLSSQPLRLISLSWVKICRHHKRKNHHLVTTGNSSVENTPLGFKETVRDASLSFSRVPLAWFETSSSPSLESTPSFESDFSPSLNSFSLYPISPNLDPTPSLKVFHWILGQGFRFIF